MLKKRFFQKYPVVSFSIFLLFVFLTADLASKNIVKMIWKKNLRMNNHELDYRIKSEVFHHDLKPMVNFPKTTWGSLFYPMTTNSLGFKDIRPREVDMHGSKPRIVLIGDSFTEGVGVGFAETFAGIAADEMAVKAVELLNAGVATYAPSIYYSKIKNLIDRGLVFQELVVFIDISDISNDAYIYTLVGDKVVANNSGEKEDSFHQEKFYNEMKESRTAYHKLEKILFRDTIASYFLLKGIHDIFWVRPLEYDFESINQRGALWTVNEEIYKEFGEIGLEKCTDALQKLHELLIEKNITMTIAVYPWPDQIVYGDLDSRHVKYFKAWASANNIQFIDLFPHFIRPNMSIAEVREVLDKYYINGDYHWNQAGHRLVADVFLKQYQSRLLQ